MRATDEDDHCFKAFRLIRCCSCTRTLTIRKYSGHVYLVAIATFFQTKVAGVTGSPCSYWISRAEKRVSSLLHLLCFPWSPNTYDLPPLPPRVSSRQALPAPSYIIPLSKLCASTMLVVPCANSQTMFEVYNNKVVTAMVSTNQTIIVLLLLPLLTCTESNKTRATHSQK